MLHTKLFSYGLIVLMFVLALVFYTQIPQPADGVILINHAPIQYGSAFAYIFAFPFIALAVLLLLNMLPHIAVYKRNIERFYKEFYGFKFFIILFVFMIYIITLLPAFGYKGNTTAFYVVVLAILFFYMGHVFKHLHRNYFIGFLTPWALSNDKLWNQTHKFGGAVMEVCAVFMLLGAIFQAFVLEILLTSALAAFIITAIYSYLIFSRGHH